MPHPIRSPFLGLLLLTTVLATPMLRAQTVPPAEATAPPDEPLPEAVVAFLGDAGREFGTAHPDAPAQVAQFGQFVGVWRTMSYAYVNGQWLSGWPALWAWRYAVGGYGIEDLFFHAEADLPPTMATYGRDSHILTTRVFDPTMDAWRVYWISNRGGFEDRRAGGRYVATWDGDQMVMRDLDMVGVVARRIVFSNITDTTFTWSSEASTDGGTTWTSRFRLEARRIR